LAHCEIGGTGKIDRNQRIADMAGPAVGSTRSRLTHMRHPTIFGLSGHFFGSFNRDRSSGGAGSKAFGME
jgi:hypothetical protein